MQNAVAITKPINYSELMSGQKIDFVQRYGNFIKTKPLMRLIADENALKESIENAQRALQNAQSKDMSSLLNELNDKRARLDEIDIFLGRVEESSPAVERAKARYGDEYKQIIVDKINKESEESGGSDIVFAPKREKIGIMPSEDLIKLDKMPVEKSGESGKMSEFYNLKVSTPKDDKSLFYRREDLRQTLKPFASKPLTNKNDGRVAYISVKKIDKFGSDDALKTSKGNGFSEAQHFEVAKHLPELYENAKLREIQPDTKHGDLNVKIPRYEIAFTLDGDIATAKITLKETLAGKFKGNKLYTIELESIAKLPNGL